MDDSDYNRKLALVRHYYNINHFAQAEAAALDLLADKPENAEGVYLYGISLFAQEKLKPAEDVLFSIIANPVYGRSAKVALARIANESGDRYKAIAMIDEAVAENPNDGNAHAIRASILSDMGQIKLAKEALQRAWELDPDGLNTLMADIKMTRRKPAWRRNERVLLERITNAEFDDSRKYYFRAIFATDFGRYREARRHIRTALSLNPSDEYCLLLEKQLRRILSPFGFIFLRPVLAIIVCIAFASLCYYLPFVFMYFVIAPIEQAFIQEILSTDAFWALPYTNGLWPLPYFPYLDDYARALVGWIFFFAAVALYIIKMVRFYRFIRK